MEAALDRLATWYYLLRYSCLLTYIETLEILDGDCRHELVHFAHVHTSLYTC